METPTYKIKITGLFIIAFLLIAGYTQSQSNCVPDSLTATNVTACTADLSWAGISGPTHVRYYPTGTTNYKYKFTTTDHIMIGHLLPETAYSWDLNNLCDGQWTEYSGNGSFTTLADTIPPPTCIPTDLTATNVTAHTADLAWAGISGPTHVRYYPTGTTNYKYKFTTTDHIMIGRLLPETAYSWDLNNFCDGHWTEYSGNGSFTTLADTIPPPTCIPTDLTATNATAHTVDLAWAGISGPTHVRYYPTGTTHYKYKFTTTDHIMIGYLLPETAYSWDLNNLCDGHWTEYSGNGSFTTLPDMYKSAIVDETADTRELSGLTVYPNPVKTGTVITFTSEDQNVYTYQIIDITGRIITKATSQATTGLNTIELDLTRYSKGIYLFNLQKGIEARHIKLIKE